VFDESFCPANDSGKPVCSQQAERLCRLPAKTLHVVCGPTAEAIALFTQLAVRCSSDVDFQYHAGNWLRTNAVQTGGVILSHTDSIPNGEFDARREKHFMLMTEQRA